MISRRGLFVVAGGALFASACKHAAAAPESCTDVSGLTAEQQGARTTAAYADRTPDPNKSCALCQQWVAPKTDGACGGCKLLGGPIHPQGTCKAFAPKG
jgi:hypothetical protein